MAGHPGQQGGTTVHELPRINSKGVKFADGDEAGLEFGKRIQRTSANVRILQMPDGEDVNSVVRKQGPEFINNHVRDALGS